MVSFTAISAFAIAAISPLAVAMPAAQVAFPDEVKVLTHVTKGDFKVAKLTGEESYNSLVQCQYVCIKRHEDDPFFHGVYFYKPSEKSKSNCDCIEVLPWKTDIRNLGANFFAINAAKTNKSLYLKPQRQTRNFNLVNYPVLEQMIGPRTEAPSEDMINNPKNN